jgi:hypothetical protein
MSAECKCQYRVQYTQCVRGGPEENRMPPKKQIGNNKTVVGKGVEVRGVTHTKPLPKWQGPEGPPRVPPGRHKNFGQKEKKVIPKVVVCCEDAREVSALCFFSRVSAQRSQYSYPHKCNTRGHMSGAASAGMAIGYRDLGPITATTFRTRFSQTRVIKTGSIPRARVCWIGLMKYP